MNNMLIIVTTVGTSWLKLIRHSLKKMAFLPDQLQKKNVARVIINYSLRSLEITNKLNTFLFEDDDECTLGTDNCDANAGCTNTDGGVTCVCNDGYSGDGITCAGK